MGLAYKVFLKPTSGPYKQKGLHRRSAWQAEPVPSSDDRRQPRASGMEVDVAKVKEAIRALGGQLTPKHIRESLASFGIEEGTNFMEDLVYLRGDLLAWGGTQY
jgi:hypothetical protein